MDVLRRLDVCHESLKYLKFYSMDLQCFKFFLKHKMNSRLGSDS